MVSYCGSFTPPLCSPTLLLLARISSNSPRLHLPPMQSALPTYSSGPAPSYYDGAAAYTQPSSTFLQQQLSSGLNYSQQPPMQQQPQRGSLPSGNLIGQNGHFSLINHAPSSQPQSQQPSPYRGQPLNGPQQQQQGNNNLMNHASMYQSGLPQQYSTASSPPPMVVAQRQQSRPQFARELFPHETVPSNKQISPPPNPDELSFHERNVRSITESPSPPPEHVSAMLSQILAPEIGNKFAQQRGPNPMPLGAPPSQQMASGGLGGLTLQQQQLYAHFNRPVPTPLQPPSLSSNGMPPAQYHSSPANSLQLSQHQTQQSMNSGNYARPAPPPGQASYYDPYGPPRDNVQSNGSMYGQQQQPYGHSQSLQQSPTHLHPSQQQGPQSHGSPYHHSQPPAQGHPSPSSIPGMSSIIDPTYYRQMKDLQARKEQLMRQQQQQQQSGQMGGGGPQMQQYQSNEYQQPPSQQPQPQYMQAPPPQIRSQSLPEFHQPSHFENIPPHMQHQMPSVRLTQQDPPTYQQNTSHLQTQQQQSQFQPQSSYPLHSPPSYALQPSPLQALHQPLNYPLQSSPQYNQQQQQSGGGGGMIAAPPGLSQGSGLQPNSNSPPFNASKQQSSSLQQQMKDIKIAGAGNVDDYNRSSLSSQSRMPAPPQPRRTQSLGEPLPPPSHEAVSVSLSKAGGRADLSRFAAGPPNLETKGFVARCCAEARRGGRHGVGGGTSSVLARMGSGGQRGSENGAASSAFFPVSNPYGGLNSSPELPESSPSPALSQKLSPLNTTPSLSQNSTPLASPLRQPRPKMAQPILPPK